MLRPRYALLALLLLLMAPLPSANAQLGITMRVDAAFDSYFRDDQWIPVRVTVANDGPSVNGRIAVRADVVRGVGDTYSSPIDLPQGSEKVAFLYINARTTLNSLRVELLDNEDLVLSNEDVILRPVQAPDQLYVVVTNSAAGSIDLTGARAEGQSVFAFQANWNADNIPTNVQTLRSVNMFVFTDTDTSALTPAQVDTLTDYIALGGHVVVTGGPNWQATAAGFTDLLPLTPTSSENAEDFGELLPWAGVFDGELAETTVIATGDLTDDAQVLAVSASGQPLLVRRELGEGTITYLAADPNTAPLRAWDGANAFWYSVATTVAPRPSWAGGFLNWERAGSASEIIPGFDLLPNVLPLCGFLILYILLIGPVNYVVLNAVNKREYAWVTIPVLIVIFTTLAWVVGGRLRGTEATISRLTAVQSWPDAPRAQAYEVIGLLSPRRTQYTLEAGENVTLRTLPRLDQPGTNALLTNTFQANVDVQQTDRFRAVDFPVDASFVASFGAYGTLDNPGVGGVVTLIYDDDNQRLRGFVRNETDHTLSGGVILARGNMIRLRDDLAPGDVEDFEMDLFDTEPPSPAPVGYGAGLTTSAFNFTSSFSNTNATNTNVRDILGNENFDFNNYYLSNIDSDPDLQEVRRRQLFLAAFMEDIYVATGRGDDVYYAGWADVAPLDLALQGANWNADAATLYLAALDVEQDRPERPVRIHSDQFTWAVHYREGLADTAPINLNIQSGGRVAFRFTPVPSAVLDEVQQVAISVNTNSSRNVPTEVWNWRTREWEQLNIGNEPFVLEEPEAYLGPQNAVIVQINGNDSSYLNIRDIRVEQVGLF